MGNKLNEAKESNKKLKYGLVIAAALLLSLAPGLPTTGWLDSITSKVGLQSAPVAEEVPVVERVEIPSNLQAQCEQTPNPTSGFRAIDGNAASTTYLEAKSVKLVGGDSIVSTTTNSDFNNTVTVACGKAYQAYLLPSAGASNGGVINFVAGAANTDNQKRFEGSQFTGVEAKIYDEESKGYLASATSQDWVDLAGTWDNSSAGVAITKDADGYFDLTLQLRANGARESVSGAKDECYLLVNTDADKWDEPATVSQDGKSLIGNNDIAAHFDSNDASALNNYEYAYKLNGAIRGGAGTSVRYYQASADGINPAVADSPVMRIVCKDYAIDDDDPDAIRYGAFKNDASKTEILGSTYTIGITIV